MNPYDQVPLGELCTVNPGAGREVYSDDMIVSFVPMAAVDERTGTIAVREERHFADVSKGFSSFENGDILFAKIGSCMENGKAALVRNLTNGIGRGSTEFYVLRPTSRVLGDYIFHFVRQACFRNKAKRSFTGTARQRVPKSFMENIQGPLPPLDEQRRIIGILNRAAKIENLRNQAADCLREFIPALFVKMFGDPVENPMGWEVRKIGDLCNVSIGRTPRRRDPHYWNGPYPWATVRDLDGHILRSTPQGITSTALREVMPPPVNPGTLLFSFKLSIGKMAFAGCKMHHNEAIAALPVRDPTILNRQFQTS